MNLRENGLPVVPLPDAEGQSAPPDQSHGDAGISLAARPRESVGFTAVHAVILGVTGVLAGSQALVAGACFFMALAASRVMRSWYLARPGAPNPQASSRAPAGLFLGALIISMAAGIAGHSVLLVQAGIPFNRVSPFAILVAIASLLVGESGIRPPVRVIRWLFPNGTIAEPDPRSDPAVASFIVLVGVLGNVCHLTVLDPLAAIMVAALVFRAGWRIIVDA